MNSSKTTLDPEFLINAYANGYFPMPDPESDEILWFDPDPRCVIKFDEFRVSRSLRRRLNKGGYQISLNTAFTEVMNACAKRAETWINPEFIRAYTVLHRAGYAHSLEMWRDKNLVGGVYGISIGGIFCAESKFHRETDASKIALYHLIEHLRARRFVLLEAQFINDHIKTLGASLLPKEVYHQILRDSLKHPRAFMPTNP